MSHPIEIATKCVTTFLDFLHIVDAVDEYVESDHTTLKTANIINRLMTFGFSTREIKKLISNPSDHHALACLKTSELASRYITLIIQLFKGPRNLDETEIEFLERAVINPVADIIRVSSERSIYEIKHCSNASLKQEGEIADNSLKSLTEKEKIKQLESRISCALKVKIAAELGLVSAVGRFYKEFYNNIYTRVFNGLAINPQLYNPQGIEDAIMNSYPIPLAFHEDLVLKKYVCAITLEPIRYPVEDPTTRRLQNNAGSPTLYEKAAILNSLALTQISPMTREPLTADQLIDRTDIQEIIEERLSYHTSQLLQYLEESALLQENLQAIPNNL